MNDQQLVFQGLSIRHYPEHPGSKDKDTGREAAEAIASQAPRLRGLVLRCLSRIGPMTADETAAHLKMDKLTVRPRFTELLRDHLIEDTGIRRRNTSGRAAKVWKVA
jgi:predicted ArsR family transcriptional regulator